MRKTNDGNRQHGISNALAWSHVQLVGGTFEHFYSFIDIIEFQWHLGVRCNCHPGDIMREIMRILKKLDFEWKIINPYHCIVQRKRPFNSTEVGFFFFLVSLVLHLKQPGCAAGIYVTGP